MRYVGGSSTPRDEIEQEYIPAYRNYYVRGEGYGFWATIEKSTGDFLGWFHFRPLPDANPDEPELGYRLHKAAWGHGYATEGSRALIRKGFIELGAERVVSSADAVNTASRRVMEKAGMTFARSFRFSSDDPFDNAVEYALSKADWEQQQGAAR